MPNLITRREHKGGAKQTTLNGSITSGAATCVITDATGWPTGAVGPFFAVINPGGATEEKVLCDSRTGTTLTFNASGRGADDTTAAAHDSGETIYHCGPVALEVDEHNEHGSKSSNAHGVTGAVVGTTDTQTLSGKTLTTPTIADLSNAGHTHAAAASGGLLGTAAPAASAVGDASVTGTATTYSRTDHKHAREAFGAVSAETTFGLASANGTAATVARSDHKHGTPADPTAGAWAAYTPTWTASTNPAIGNGTLTGRFKQIGKTVHFVIEVVMGSTTTFGSGNYLFGLPVAAVDTTHRGGFPSIHLDDSPTARQTGVGTLNSVNNFLIVDSFARLIVSPTVPYTWASGDTIRVSGTYEAA